MIRTHSIWALAAATSPRISVIPAEAGIHTRWRCGSFAGLLVWIPASAGMSGLGLRQDATSGGRAASPFPPA
ncbi:hypothetical protein FHY05_003261 [Sphingomonas sp. BK580]|nr:hypothetical protein [Sphingomonas sp. BK580]